MSDRHIVEKNFNHLLEEYRSEILPDVVENWQGLLDEEKNSLDMNKQFFLWITFFGSTSRHCIRSAKTMGANS